MDIESSLCALDEVVAAPAFKEYQLSFVESHCHLFDNIEENKLEYMELHKQYETQIEAHLEQKLAQYPGFSMETLMAEQARGNVSLGFVAPHHLTLDCPLSAVSTPILVATG